MKMLNLLYKHFEMRHGLILLFIHFVKTEIEKDLTISQDPAARLFTKLFQNHNVFLRPVVNYSDPVTVTVNPILNNIEKVNERNEVIKFNHWMHMSWVDETLTWKPDEFDQISTIQAPSRLFWVPDVVPDSIINLTEIPSSKQVKCTIKHTGHIMCSFNQVIATHCKMKVRMFPFDQQNCSLVYYSWSYPYEFVQLTTLNSSGNRDFFHENTEWELISFTNEVIITNYTTTFSEVHYFIVIKRKPQYYIFTLILPSFMITLLALVGLFSPFNAAGDREEKVSMGLTTLLTMAVLLLVISEQMPRTADGLPLIGIYVLYEIIVSSVATCITVWVLNLHRRVLSGGKMPDWLRYFSETAADKHKTDQNDDVFHGGFRRRESSKQPHGQNVPMLLEHCLRHLMSIRVFVDQKVQYQQDYFVWMQVCDRLEFVLLCTFLGIHMAVSLLMFMLAYS